MYFLKNRIYVLLFFLTFCVACNNPKVKEGEIELSNVIPESASAGDNTCLLSYATKYDQLFTFDDAVKLTGLAKADGEMDYNKVLKSTAYHDVSYEWPSERKTKVKVSTMEIEIPEKNYIVIGGIEPETLEDFSRTYKAATDAELAEANKSINKTIDEAYEGKSESETANKAMDRVKEMGQSKKDVKAVTGNLQEGVFSKIAKAYSPVNNLADAASWNSIEKCLYVLKNGVKVNIIANLSEHNNYNKNKAIEVAKMILAKCD